MYETYKNGGDSGLVEAWNRTCNIIYRNPDNSIAEIIEPHPWESLFPDSFENDITEEESDVLPF